MNWGGIQEFVAMGGYGRYVWGSYGLTLVVVVLEFAAARRRHRQALARLALNEEMES